MAIVYLLHNHDNQLVGEHIAETHLAFGEEVLHEDRRYLVVGVPPARGQTFIDPLFDGYALAGGDNAPSGQTTAPTSSLRRPSNASV